MKVKSKRIPDPNKPGAKIEDFWGPAQQMLADTQFLPSLKDFDKDNINPKIIEKIRPYLLLPEFVPEVVQKASKAAYGLCCWVRAMESYDRVAKVGVCSNTDSEIDIKCDLLLVEFDGLRIRTPRPYSTIYLNNSLIHT